MGASSRLVALRVAAAASSEGPWIFADWLDEFATGGQELRYQLGQGEVGYSDGYGDGDGDGDGYGDGHGYEGGTS